MAIFDYVPDLVLILRFVFVLLFKMLSDHIDEQRQYLSCVSRPNKVKGMPYYTARKQEISVNLPQ